MGVICQLNCSLVLAAVSHRLTVYSHGDDLKYLGDVVFRVSSTPIFFFYLAVSFFLAVRRSL